MSRREAPGARHWNTWDPVHPAELVHLPTGVHVGLAAYSDAAGRFSRFPPGAGVTLGPRTVDATAIDLELALAGTRLAVRIGGAGPESFKIAWRILANGEWGLRFWLLVCLWCEGEPGRDGVPARDGEPGGDGGGCAYDPSTTEMTAPAGDGWVVVKGSRFPLMATFHHDLAALKAELEDEGYFYLASRGTAGPLGVLRYNLEEMPAFEVAAAWAPDRGGAAARADGALAAGPPAAAPALHGGRFEGALDALRDCVAWNTVWDASNRRPYTALSRSWVAQKFGGWGVWLNDVVYHGLMGGLFDADLAHENQRAVFDGATPAGNLPCLVTGNDAWVDRSQPPIVGFVTWCQYLRGGDRRFLEDAWPVLSANHEWWWRERDGNRNGLLEYGTSPVGDGLYRGTKLAAKDESMMDNSPVHDEAVLMEAAHTLDCEDVALNSFVALDGEMLALIARALGLGAEAAALEQRTEGLKTRIREQLWDDRRAGLRQPPVVGAFRPEPGAHQLLPPNLRRGERGPGQRPGRAPPERPSGVRRRIYDARRLARRPCLRRQRLLARAHLAAAQLHRLLWAAPLRPRRRRPNPRRGELPDLHGELARPYLRRELQRRQRARRRPARHRPVLHLGRP